MGFIAVLACTLAFSLVFKDAIRKAPGAFYCLALLASVLYAATSFVSLPLSLQMLLFQLMQKGTLATALFVVVMYMGVFRDVRFVRQRLLPTRATLSIVACILALGHVAKYAVSFAPALAPLAPSVAWGLALGAVAFALMAILGVTSFQAVKRRMGTQAWTALQRWAYLFYALLFAHIALFLAPASAQSPLGASGERLIAYMAVFGIYALLRTGKAIYDLLLGRARHVRRSQIAVTTEPDDQASATAR